jgi:cysteinyl-tRNA synthetase
MYVCGVTVYDYCHLGHARTYIVWDTVRRYLQWRGYSVTYVQNFTDVDDKILKRACSEGTTMEAIAERYMAAYFEDMQQLNILPADRYPQATQHLDAIYRLIQDLELRSFAYRVRSSDGEGASAKATATAEDVYYAVRKFADYGKLSGRRLEDLQAGASGRVGEEGQQKRDPFDFALWKAAERGEEGFQSPWGWGRPGWHIECSAMVRSTLGDRIDIHAGGADLKFPHHENEIAQSEPVTGKPFAKYWLHNGFLNIDGEKMSKSLGNFTTIRDFLQIHDPMALRLFFLQTQYRSPIDLTDASLEAAENGWKTLSQALVFAGEQKTEGMEPDAATMSAFQAAMDDDFNTPGALAVAFELSKLLVKEQNQIVHTGQGMLTSEERLAKAKALSIVMDVLGLVAIAAEQPTATPSAMSDEEIQELLDRRLAARQSKNFQAADAIRDRLREEGITVIDQPDGTSRWVRQ